MSKSLSYEDIQVTLKSIDRIESILDLKKEKEVKQPKATKIEK